MMIMTSVPLQRQLLEKSAPSDLRKTVKNYWQAEYRTTVWIWNGWMQKMVLDIEDAGINTTYILARGLMES